MDPQPNDDLKTKSESDLQSDHSSPEVHLPIQKKSKKKWVFLVLLLLIVVGLGVAAAVSYFVTQKTVAPEVPVTKTATKFNSSEDLITSATSTLKGSAIEVTSKDGMVGQQTDGYYVYSLPSYRIDTQSYFNTPTEGAGAGYGGDSAVSRSNFTTLARYFTANNFSEVASEKTSTGYISATQSVTYANNATFESPDMICAIADVDATPTTIKNHIAYVACATKDSYKKAADAIKPFAAAYTKSNEDADVTKLTFANPTVKEAASGYKTVALYHNDQNKISTDNSTIPFFLSLYYTAPNSTDWTFFADTTYGTDPLCSVFNTDTAKKAFAGTTCIDASKKVSVVK